MAKAKKSELTAEERLRQALVPAEEQPYEVPENWCWVRLCPCARIRTGKKDANYGGKEGDYYFFTCANEPIRCNGYSFDCKAILLAGNGDIGNISIYEGKFEAYQRTYVVEVYKPFITEYFYYYFKYRWLEYNKDKMFGTAIPYIRLGNLNNFEIPAAPLSEQQRIVDIIESLFSKLDEAKEKAQEALDGFENRRAALIHSAFKGELTKEWRLKKGISKDDWDRSTLNDVADYKKGPFGSSITKAMFVPKGEKTYKVYEQGNAIRKTLDYGHYYIPEEKYNELKGFAVNAGDIIISCAGTIGEVYKLPDNCEPGVINQALMRVRIYDNIDENFFIYYFGEVLRGDVVEQSNGTAIKNIPPFKIMKAMEIMLPSLEEQREIVSILNNALEKENESKQIIMNVIESIELIKKSVLAKAFRGKLGTNDPDEESAEESVKRVLEQSVEEE